ncbi:unnamed protein product [Brassicogethes aeneus]|uniref:Uncharacterized protein n=1 Tax=Brassicogethes aeneus TaxID=1431903 RepID=A0A9P0ARM2_BRAAE|nr:unnamed protein product [Brassicogethes aeneus]
MSNKEITNFSEEFQILFRLFNEFYAASSTSEIQEVYEKDGETNIKEKLTVISMNKQTTVTPNEYNLNEIKNDSPEEDNTASYSADEIMNMPVILLAENDNLPHTNETTSSEINLDNSNIENYLLWQKTPERSGKRQTDRLPFVITSSAFKKVCEEKMGKNTEKDKEKARKLATRIEKKKLKEEKIKNKKCPNNRIKTKKSNNRKCTATEADKIKKDSKQIISKILLESNEIGKVKKRAEDNVHAGCCMGCSSARKDLDKTGDVNIKFLDGRCDPF